MYNDFLFFDNWTVSLILNTWFGCFVVEIFLIDLLKIQ